MKHTPPRNVSRRTFLKTGAVAAAVMACAGALSACWVPVDGNSDIVVTEKIKTIEGVKYTVSADVKAGINFNLKAEPEEGVTAPTFDENKFSVSFYSAKKNGYYIQDAKADSFTFNKENGSCWGRVSSSTVENAAGIGFVDSDFTTNDRVEVKYQLAPGKNIIWKIRLESTATTTVR